MSDMTAIVDLVREAQATNFSHGVLRATGLDPAIARAVARTASQLERAVRARSNDAIDPTAALSMALLAGYPDRVARRVRAGASKLALAGGGAAELSETSLVRSAEWLVALDAEERASRSTDGGGARGGVVVRLAAGVEPEWLMDAYPAELREEHEVTWDAKAERALSRETLTWGGLVVLAAQRDGAASDEASRVLAEAALAEGPSAFAAEGALDRWLSRARFAASLDASLAPLDDAAVARTLTDLCFGLHSFAELRAAGLLDALRRATRAADVDRLAPDRVQLVGGRSVEVKYESGKPPSISSRLQDFFGMVEGPRVGGGRLALVLELLAPNGRAVQVTSDLAGFWQRNYPAIRKELMRRYPRHSWPEDPTRPAPRMRPRT
jgi:ATP-dependent helicase HrpB